MTGVVLCGGQSTRMGSDKGLLRHDSVTWAQRAAEKLSALDIPVLLSVNNEQFPLYKNTFPNAAIIEDDRTLNVGGPLRGILSVHRRYPEKDLFILACDMVNMHKDVLEHLVLKSTSHSGEEYVYINDDDVVETLCAIYTSAGLKKVHRKYIEGKLKKHSMRFTASLLDTIFIPIPANWNRYFSNINSPADLDAL